MGEASMLRFSDMSTPDISRRDIIRAGVIAGTGIVAASALAAAAPQPRPFRVAHLTDMHVQPELRAGEGYAAALASLVKLDPQPDLIITGGDHVMDSTDQSLARAKAQWDVYNREIARIKRPIHSILGNHDVFGWGVREISDQTVGYGKELALDQLEMTRAYYSFEAGGWKFIMLDSMTRRDNTYLGALGPEQTEWLKGELQSTSSTTPIIVFSHIPILAVCVFFDGDDRLGEKDWNIPDAWMHRDARELLNLFEAHNVRLLVSGHIHLVDRAEYRGMTFICDGAVCGNWWKGPCQQFPEGYGVIDLHLDGHFDHQYLSYGWKAQA
jgi:Icc protein